MAFAAELGGVPPACWLLYCAGVAWTAVYDTFYAMVDRDDDLKIGVRSLAILLGDADRAVTATLQALIIVLLIFSGQQFELGPAYYAGVAVGAGLFVWQQWLIRHRERQACFRAFLNNNLFGLAVFAGIAADYRFF
jgi:4-hydroxybenzoate polyprenyltransferase